MRAWIGDSEDRQEGHLRTCPETPETEASWGLEFELDQAQKKAQEALESTAVVSEKNSKEVSPTSAEDQATDDDQFIRHVRGHIPIFLNGDW